MRIANRLAVASLALGAGMASGCDRARTGFAPPPPGCGDGVLDEGEECDDGHYVNSDSEPDACRTDCLAPFCGDGVVDSGEQCDDAGAWGGDGCTPICTAEDGQIEREPNDDRAAADPWDGRVLYGALPAGDRDCFSFPLPACAAVEAGLIGECPTPATLTLLDPAGLDVATGAPGADGCAVLDPAQAPGARFVAAGTWTLCVRGLLDAAVPFYALRISVVAPEDASYPIPAADDPDGDGRPDSCDADRDGDGVDDEVDDCPDTPNGPLAPPLAPTADGFIRAWLTVGPFTGLGSAMDCRPTDANLVAADDATVMPALGDRDAAGVNPWIVLWSWTDRIEFLTDYGGVPAPRELYSAVYVRSATTRDLTLGVGPDDGARVWLNGAQVMDITPCQGTSIDSTTAMVTLNAGWNTLVIKVYDQGGGWGNYVRFLDAGVPVTDLELSLSPGGPWAFDQSDSDSDGIGDVCDLTPL
jgi:cysteine-rich repeat protein